MVNLPDKGVIVPLDTIKTICLANRMENTWIIIEQDPPKNPFKSDGCSLWPDSWGSDDLYPACLKHDIKYWAGYIGDHVLRLKADLELSIDVLVITNNVYLSLTMFSGVRIGGKGVFRQKFSWAFGRI